MITRSIQKHTLTSEYAIVEISLKHMVPDQPAKSYNLINIDYYMEIFMSYPISTRDTHISSRAFSPRADMGVSG